MTAIMTDRMDLTGPAGGLEVRLECRDTPRFIGVVCHPHPLFGGTMQNKVVTTLSRTVRDEGGVGLRFNFRGVGHSQGAYDEGIGETADLLAVVEWARREYPALPLWLAGFSFGSFVALRGARALADEGAACRHLLLVAPPVHHFDFTAIRNVDCPVTVIQGEEDEVVPPGDVYAWADGTPLRPEVLRFPESGHFFHGKLNALRDTARQTMPVTG